MDLAKVGLSCKEISFSAPMGDVEIEEHFLVLARKGATGCIYPTACPNGHSRCIGETVCGRYLGHKEAISGGTIVRCGGWP